MLGVLLCLAFFASEASAQVQVGLLGTLTRQNNSVTKVMKAAHCDFSWLAQVLADSGIHPGKLRELPVGQKVLLQSGSCKQVPPQSIANLSAVLLQLPDTRQLASLEESLRKVRGELGESQTKVKKVSDENLSLRQEVERLSKLPAPVAILPSSPQGEARVDWLLVLFVGIALLIVGFIVFFATKSSDEDKLVAPKKLEVENGGKSYVFKLSGAVQKDDGTVVPTFKCPLCTEKRLHGKKVNLQENLLEHLETKHAEERMEVEVDPLLLKTTA